MSNTVRLDAMPDHLSDGEVRELLRQGKAPLTFVCNLAVAVKFRSELAEFFRRKGLRCVRVDGYISPQWDARNYTTLCAFDLVTAI